MPKTSDIWKFFEKSTSENSAKCLICDKTLACNKGSTKGLWDHFKSMHEKEYCQFMNQEDVALKNQSSICKFIESDSQDDADIQIANLMIRQNCSFLFIESPELKKLFKLAYPRLELRGRQHFRKNVIPKMALNIRKKITQHVGDDYYAITSDGWSQITKSPALLSITIHHVNANFERGDFVLDAIPIESHSGIDIAKYIEESLKSNGLQMNKLICLIRDDASNMKRSSSLLGINRFEFISP
ncbi:unnamed protein product [Meloidogyne enterolobii]|uniref:Uncharacterized protein n=1 Tax=Meloidogyne enterolobii TaxID=390850 RepID=A0ACB1AUT4_MELEN